MYAIRRHRRRLLFPPGLLALGFLLLLGCLALRPWYRLLGPRYVMQLTVPPKPVSDVIFPWFNENEKYNVEAMAKGLLVKYSQLARFRSWQDFAFTGEPARDAATAQEARLAFLTMQADTLSARGIRIRLEKQAQYASLVQTLNWANTATGKYILDIHHEPITLYALTDAYKPRVASPTLETTGNKIGIFTCGYQPPKPPPASFEVQMQNWLTRWQQTWSEAFSSSLWQLPILSLLIIIAVSSWKMARWWHTA